MAMTADGKIATANRAVSSFGSRLDREHLLELRATADAVMAGAGTVNEERVTLGPGPARFRSLRRSRGLAECNLRIVVSGAGTVSPQADVFRDHSSPVIVLATERIAASRLRQLSAVADEVRICGRAAIDFRVTFRWLWERWGVRRLLCEGGGELNSALFREGLVDELHLTICPSVLGGQRAPTIADGPDPRRLSDAARLRLVWMRRMGSELFLRYCVRKEGRK